MSQLKPSVEQRFALVDLARLRVGITLSHSILEHRDDRQTVLVGSGVTLTSEHLNNLGRRGISQVRINRAELARLLAPETAHRNRRSLPPDEPRSPQVLGCLSPGIAGRTRPFDPHMVRRFIESDRVATEQLTNLFQELDRGKLADGKQLGSISKLNVEQLVLDPDAFLLSSILPGTKYTFSRHSLQVSKLATAIASVHGCRPEEILELNVGCLIHDVGMQRIDSSLLDAPRSLTQVEYLEITKHPGTAFELIRNLPTVPSGARMVAYQMHERMNGSGYPRQRRGEQIHLLARIAAVADVYIALVSPRSYRPAMLPYSAMEHLVRGSRSGLFDPAVVRALLETVSMFPIGSYVELSDGRTGQVLRANSGKYTAPFIQVDGEKDPQAATIVDLSQEQGLSIVRPLPDSAQPNVAIPTKSPDKLEDIFWE